MSTKTATWGRYFWNLVNNCVAHFWMGVFGPYCPMWLLRFHDWTANKAWPETARLEGTNPEYWDKIPAE